MREKSENYMGRKRGFYMENLQSFKLKREAEYCRWCLEFSFMGFDFRIKR